MQNELPRLRTSFRASTSASDRERIYRDARELVGRASPLPEVTRTIRAVFSMLKRTETGNRYLAEYDRAARRFQLIGGKKEASDPSPEATAIRETREELLLPERTGVDVVLLHAGLAFQGLSPTTLDYTRYEVDVYFVRSVEAGCPNDSETLKWLELETLIDETVAGEFRRANLAPVLRRLPATRFGHVGKRFTAAGRERSA